METMVKQPLTLLQLELLKIFSRDISETDLLEIKKFYRWELSEHDYDDNKFADCAIRCVCP